MRSLWNQLNHKLKHQVYLRVLPVVALSILVVGAAGWMVLNQEKIDGRTGSGFHELQDLQGNLNLRVVKEALSLEARQSSNQAVSRQEVLDSRFQLDLTRAGLVAAVARIDGQGPSAPQTVTTWLEPGAGHGLQTELASWVQTNHEYLKADYQPGTWAGTKTKGAPYLADSSPWHSTFLFPAVLVGLHDDSPAQALLPVLVKKPGPDEHDSHLYLIKLATLVYQCQPGLWFCLVDESGRVLHATGNDPVPGSLLAEVRKNPDHQIFSAANGAQLLDSLDPQGGPAVGRAGGGLVPGIVLRRDIPEMGFSVVMVDPMVDLADSMSGYLWLLVLAVILSVGGSILGINQVMKRSSDRLTFLARNMKSLANGNYGGRLIPGQRDEVGQLISYFNLMSNSLEDAHSEIKEKAAHLRAALENLRMLDKAKDDFMVLISHEVRTPLTAIMGGVDYLKKSVEKVNGDEREVLDRLNVPEITDIIQSSGERLSGFMTDAIQMTSMGSEGAKLNLRPVPVGDLVGEGLCGILELASEQQVAVHNQLDSQWDWSILCDPETLKVGIGKIFRNAVTHNRSGGVVIIREATMVPGLGPISGLIDRESLRLLEGQKSFHAYRDEDLRWRMIEIFNTGHPIPADRRAALFGKFELVGRIENHQKGSGLSLPIAKAAIESHGGRIFMHSDGMDGNSFFVMLPTLRNHSGRSDHDSTSPGNEVHQSVGGAPGNKDISQVGDSASFEVELNDLCSSILGGGDETGGGVDGSGSADHQEKVTIGCRSK